jgi:4-coumarate--CoA ligase
VPKSFDLCDDGILEFVPFYMLLMFGAATSPEVGQDDAGAILYSLGMGRRSKGMVIMHRDLITTVELFMRFKASQ